MKRFLYLSLSLLLTILCLILSFTSNADAQIIYPNRGGTGATTAPSYGQVLVGNSSGTYTPTATSSLGIVATAATSSLNFWLGTKTTDNLSEGVSNLYWTLARFAGALAGTTTDALDEGSTNQYFTQDRARGSISSSATGLTYNVGTGALSLTSGYVIPKTASTTEWATTYGWGNHASQGYITDGNTGWDNSYGFVTSSFSSTSADYWDTTKSRWATTSAAYHITSSTTLPAFLNYWTKSGSNLSYTGGVTISGNATTTGYTRIGTTTAPMVNGTIVVDGIAYPKTGAGVIAAVTDCKSLYQTCGQVYVPAGLYTFSSAITVYSGLHLVGSGASTTIFTLANSANSSLVTSPAAGGLEDVYISGITFDGNGANQTGMSTGNALLYFTGHDILLNNIFVERVTVKNSYQHCVFFTGENNTNYSPKGVSYSYIYNCGVGSTGFGLYTDYAPNTTFAYNVIDNVDGDDAIEIGHLGKSHAIGNTIIRGQLQFPFGSHSVIANNWVYTTIQNDANTADNVTITGNHVINSTPSTGYGGISVYGASSTIANNHVYVNDVTGILLKGGGGGHTVQNNVVRSPSKTGAGGDDGIFENSASNSKIIGNQIEGFFNGLRLNTSDNLVSNNTVSTSTNGIVFTDSTISGKVMMRNFVGWNNVNDTGTTTVKNNQTNTSNIWPFNVGVSGWMFEGNATTTGDATTTGAQYVGSLTVGSLSGFLKATAGKLTTALVNLASDVTGTLPVGNGGTGAATFGQGWLYSDGGTGALAASTSPTINYITATSTTASSTFANGINLTRGCFAVNGTCLSTSVSSSFGQAWEIANGFLAPTTTQTVLLNNGFVAQASSTISGAFTVGTTTATSTFSSPLIFNRATGKNLVEIRPSGNIGTSNANIGEGSLVVNNTSNTLTPGLYVSSDQAGVASNPLAIIRSTDSAYNQGLLWLLGASTNTGGNAFGIKVQDGNPDIEFVESDQTTPAGKYEIDGNNDLIRINGRNTADNSYDTIAWFARNDKGATGAGGRFCLGCGSSDVTGSRFNIVATSTPGDHYLSLSTSTETLGGVFKIDRLGSTTAMNGMNITAGCYAVNGACLSAGGTPGGSNTQVQFNDSSSFGGDAGFTYDKNNDWATLGKLTVSGVATTSGLVLNAGTPYIDTGAARTYVYTDTNGSTFFRQTTDDQLYDFLNGSGSSIFKLDGGNTVISSPYKLNITSSALSTFTGGIDVGGNLSVGGRATSSTFHATSTTASSTFANGINLTGGCYALLGSCLTTNNIGEGSNLYYTDARVGTYITGSTTLPSFLNYWTKSGTTLSYTAGSVGIGTTTPVNALHVLSSSYPQIRVGQSQTAFGTLGITVNGFGVWDNTNFGFRELLPGSTLAISGNLALGNNTAFSRASAPTGGLVVQGNTGIGTTSPFAKLSIHANNGETNKLLFVVGSSTAAATSTFLSITNEGKLGIGTTTPRNLLHVSAGASATTTIEWGDPTNTSKVCINSKNSAGAEIRMYVNGTTQVIELGRCT